MKNLISFLKRFRDFIIFFFLQVFILGLFFNSKNYHKATFINSSSSLSGWVNEKKHNITKHFYLESEMDSLIAINAELLNKSPESFYHLQNRIYSVSDSLYEQKYEYFPGTVINASTNKRNNYITIDRGFIHGVEKEMGVINGHGIVGFVIDVSKHYSVVKTILSENINIGVKIKDRNDIKGQIKWNGKDSEICQLYGITSDEKIEEGEKVITQGGKGIFPEGIEVGVVKTVENNGGLTLEIDLSLSANFSGLYTVFFIKNLHKQELKSIESNYYND